MNESTRKHWNDRSDEYFGKPDYEISLSAIKKEPFRAFQDETYVMIKEIFPSLDGKKVLVASSGDNLAAFGLHLLGASVTSADLSEKQLENAAAVAAKNNWDIRFIQADSMTLDSIADGEYDLVYTSNGAHVWISDLSAMYRSFRRVLKPNGYYIYFETHPFHRPFDGSYKEPNIIKPYEETGPFGDPPTYTWRIEDFLRALLGAGFTIRDYRDIKVNRDAIIDHGWYYKTYEEREKDGYAMFDWRKNPMAALPTWMGVCAQNVIMEDYSCR